jgi:hypothetical protein
MHVTELMYIELQYESMIELANDDVTSGSGRLLEAEIDNSPLLIIEKRI